MATPAKTGPLTLDELLTLWRSVTDEGYSRPLVEGGEGSGLEAVTQGLEQFATASRAVDESTQAMFLLPWSGQTAPPAQGAARATCVLRATRRRLLDRPLTLVAGQVAVEQETVDFGRDGPQLVRTGRRYRVATTTTFVPGEAGPIDLPVEAERVGEGYNVPAPGTLTAIVQPGVGLSNDGASVLPGTVGAHRLVTKNQPDVVIPEHVGQYVQFVAGANAGALCRVVGYEPPVPEGSNPNGGTAILAPTVVLGLSLVAGTFEIGEEVEQFPSGARGVFFGQGGLKLVLDRTSGTFVAGQVVVGAASGAQGFVAAIEQEPTLASETGTAVWRVPDWGADLELTVTNETSPTSGRAAMLDELGSERRLPRAPGESDDAYRRRVATPADTVSPRAIQRAVNRILARYGASGCLREVGTLRMPGLYYDGDASNANPAIAFAYDLDFDARPQDRFKLSLDYADHRAFFLVGVPPSGLGEFGAAYDVGASNAFDAFPFHAFHDGFPATAAMLYRNVWQDVNRRKAGGVGFDLYLETVGCDV